MNELCTRYTQHIPQLKKLEVENSQIFEMTKTLL